MLITVAHVGPKPPRSGDKAHFDALTRLYLDRIHPWHTTRTEAFATEAALLTSLTRPAGQSRTPILPVFLDSRGRALASSEFAQWFGVRRDQGTQHMLFAVGPSDGWSPLALEQIREQLRTQSGLLLSFGPITMAHDLARLVLAEQLYRACTILAGHPYHTGH